MSQVDRVENIHQRIGQVRARLDALNNTVEQSTGADSRPTIMEAAAEWQRHSAPRVASAQMQFDSSRRSIHHDAEVDTLQRHLASMKEQHNNSPPAQSTRRAAAAALPQVPSWQDQQLYSSRDASISLPRGNLAKHFSDDAMGGRSMSGGGHDDRGASYTDDAPPARRPENFVAATTQQGEGHGPQVLSFYEVRPQAPSESMEPQPAQGPPVQQPPPSGPDSVPTSFSQMQALLRAKLAEFAAERSNKPTTAAVSSEQDAPGREAAPRPAFQASSRRGSVATEQQQQQTHAYAPASSSSQNLLKESPSSSRFAPAPVPTYEPKIAASNTQPVTFVETNAFGTYQESNRSQSGDSQQLQQGDQPRGRVASAKRIDSVRAKQQQPLASSFRKSPAASAAAVEEQQPPPQPGSSSLISQLVGSFSDPKKGAAAQQQQQVSREHFLSTPLLRSEAKRQPEITRDSPRIPNSRPQSPRTGSNADQQSSSRSQTPRKTTPIAPAVVASAAPQAAAGGGGVNLVGSGTDAHLVALSGAELFAILRLRGVISSHGQTGEHLLPLACCHSMFLSTDEYSQLLQLRELLKTQARASPKNASERRRLSPGASPAAATNSTLSLRATEAALILAEQRKNRSR